MAEAIGSGLGAVLRGAAGPVAGGIDSVMGAVLGATQAFVLTWLVGGLIASSSIPVVSAESQKSIAVRTLLDLLPPPGEVMGELGSILTVSGLPQVFVGGAAPGSRRRPPDAGRGRGHLRSRGGQHRPRRGPGLRRLLHRHGLLRGRRVLRHECPRRRRSERVTLRGSRRRPAARSSLRPDLDVASFGAAALPRSSWRRRPRPRRRRAALGHPNGAPDRPPGRRHGRGRARGRDLYGGAPVIRDVLELQAAIEPGDSGGPLVLANGTVGGVVFAESRTDASVGYALDPTAVAVAIMSSVGDTTPVDTGPCIR